MKNVWKLRIILIYCCCFFALTFPYWVFPQISRYLYFFSACPSVSGLNSTSLYIIFDLHIFFPTVFYLLPTTVKTGWYFQAVTLPAFHRRSELTKVKWFTGFFHDHFHLHPTYATKEWKLVGHSINSGVEELLGSFT